MRTRWLRSRWTVVALVPAFFLTGFALVAALGGGSEDPEPRAAAEEPGVSGQSTTVIATTATGEAPTETSPAPSTTTTTGAGGGTTTTTTTAQPPTTGGGGGGRVPSAPPPGEITIDYGRWEGMFEVEAMELVPDFALSTVVGELKYLGGVDCQVGLVVVKSWYFNASGERVGTGLWESTFATGEGGEVTGREPLPFEAWGSVSEFAESAALRFTRVECL